MNGNNDAGMSPNYRNGVDATIVCHVCTRAIPDGHVETCYECGELTCRDCIAHDLSGWFCVDCARVNRLCESIDAYRALYIELDERMRRMNDSKNEIVAMTRERGEGIEHNGVVITMRAGSKRMFSESFWLIW